MNYKYLSYNFTRHILVFIASAVLLLWQSTAVAQSTQGQKVTGKVTSATDASGLPGVSIVIKGTTKGTITDMDGNYSLTVGESNAVLVYSFIGYTTLEVPLQGKSVLNVTMEENVEALDEVVVTALGINRKEKSLGYSVGKVEGDELTRVAQENVLNSLSGKVSGVTINSTGGAGSSVSMVIRGATSLNTDNQPLFVVDGVPMSNSLNNIGGFGNGNRVDYGNSISDLNPEDIENVSILKGPSAAALYGTRAGNGVVLITTKKAKEKQPLTVSITSNTVIDVPYRFLNMHSKFASGILSFTPEEGSMIVPLDYSEIVAAGSELDKGYFAIQPLGPVDANGNPVPSELVSHPNNMRNFLNNGFTTTNGVSVSNSTDVVNYRIGFTNMTHNGLIPNTDLFKNNYSVNVSAKLTNNFTLSSNVNLGRNWSNNRPASNEGTNALDWAYRTPPNHDIRDLQDYWVPGKEGLEVIKLGKKFNNPYFIANEVNNSFLRDRVYGNLVGEWKIDPSFTITGRYTIDKSEEKRETKMAPGYSEEPNNGTYGITKFSHFERNADIMGTYHKDWDKFTLSASLGGNALYATGTSVTAYAAPGAGLIVPNLYTLGNISSSALIYGSSWWQKGIYSAYSIANLGFDEVLYLDLTARNDWSSTLPAENRSYFYPSASLSLMANELLNMGNNINMLKLRGGWAQVGNDTSPYSLYPVYGNAGQWGDAIRLSKSGTILTPDLKPEEATSLEYGLDIKAFNNRVRFEGTYYTVDNRNQILSNIPLAPSSGYSRMNINAGLLQSKGVELLLGLSPVKSKDWNWDLNLNFTKTQTKIIELDEGVNVIEFWEDGKVESFGYVAGSSPGEDGLVGNLYSPRMMRVEDPNSPYYRYPILENEGFATAYAETQETYKIGNYNPDFLMGLQSSMSYKNFSLNMTFDWRQGGQYVSQTFRYFVDGAFTQTWLDKLVYPGAPELGPELRQWVLDNEDDLLLQENFTNIGGPTAEYGGFPETYTGLGLRNAVLQPGVFQTEGADTPDDYSDDVYEENLGDIGSVTTPYIVTFPWDFGTPTTFDASYVKLREISLSYHVPSNYARSIGMKNIDLSLYSRNIMLWTKESSFGIDPERAFKAEGSRGNRGTQFKQGIERYNVDPWVMPIGFKVGLTF